MCENSNEEFSSLQAINSKEIKFKANTFNLRSRKMPTAQGSVIVG